MINLIDELTVYEVVVAEYDDDYNYIECVDAEYLLSPSYMDAEDVINEYILHNEKVSVEGRMIQVYEARSSTVTNDRGVVDLLEVDCCTGGNGSPVLEVYYDSEGNEINVYE